MKHLVLWPCVAGVAALALGVVARAPARVAPAHQERRADPTIQRDEVLRELARSGPESSPEAGAKIRAVLRGAAEQVGGGGGVRVEAAVCYRKGCSARVVFHDPAAFASLQFPLGRACKDAWPGELFLSGPEPQPTGEVMSTLVLFDEG